MRKPRTDIQKKLDAAMRAYAALYLLDSIATLLSQMPRVDNKLANDCAKLSEQVIKHRNRMLPLADKADQLIAE